MVTIQELVSFFTHIQKALCNTYGADISAQELVMSNMIKLSEETGEVAEKVLLWRNRQDSRKGDFSIEHMGGELADVIFCVGLLAQSLGVDLEEALLKRKKELSIQHGFTSG